MFLNQQIIIQVIQMMYGHFESMGIKGGSEAKFWL